MVAIPLISWVFDLACASWSFTTSWDRMAGIAGSKKAVQMERVTWADNSSVKDSWSAT